MFFTYVFGRVVERNHGVWTTWAVYIACGASEPSLMVEKKGACRVTMGTGCCGSHENRRVMDRASMSVAWELCSGLTRLRPAYTCPRTLPLHVRPAAAAALAWWLIPAKAGLLTSAAPAAAWGLFLVGVGIPRLAKKPLEVACLAPFAFAATTGRWAAAGVAGMELGEGGGGNWRQAAWRPRSGRVVHPGPA